MSDLFAWQHDLARKLQRPRRRDPALHVYRNTVLKGTIDALADNYPTVVMLLGDAMFTTLARAFAARRPPGSPVLAHYGAGFDRWLGRHPVAADLPYLSDVARIDRLHTESHLAADAECLDPASLAEMSADQWSRCRAQLHPATRFDWFALPAPDIWIAHRHPDLAELAPDWQPQGILLTRPTGGVEPLTIDAGLHRILMALKAGLSVGAAALQAAELHPDCCITDAFRILISSGAVATLTPEFEP
ncbi:HvfC/BufC N-terminal domain-containing protein [Sandarakinorhabdus rubra]|uniref:HvfC/BufC N-terminal domain-containing protein n=1 Tax=Sandarakinorhabdus rubra TaxID=2672568 RepID=UPI0013DB06ED|nr:DNA-binding domain-containing protein [Sandarakinorhabdus rubra]